MRRSDHARAILLLIVLLLPNLAWIGLDRSLWPWDQAWYATHSVELFFTLLRAPSTWIGAMTHSLGRQAPAIAWLGQWFVPIGLAIGSIDAGLLLSLLATQAAALWLVYRAIGELAGRCLGAAATALIVMGAAPLSIALSHYYLVEMSQMTAVAWFVLLTACAPRWSRLTLATQLVLATSFAMLAKVSSPLFCILPGLVALYFILRPSAAAAAASRSRHAIALACATGLATMTVAWYTRNVTFVIAHVSMAATGSVAELYGKQLQFVASLRDWLTAVHASFFSPLTAVVSTIVVAIAIVSTIVAMRARHEPFGRFEWAAMLAALQIAIVLGVFALSSNRDSRYLLPLLPYIAVIVSWSVWRLQLRAVTLIVLAAFLLQWGQAHAQALGMIAPFSDTSVWLNAYNSNPRDRAIARALVARTCTAGPPVRNALGVQLLGLNPPALAYTAVKMQMPAHESPCEYDAIAYFDRDADRAWGTLMANRITYYIALDPTSRRVPDTAVDRTLNQLNEPILQRVEGSHEFAREPDLAEDPSIWIFIRAGRVTTGRALSDRGEQARAIEVLRAATAAEPGNVEAWANLALACERGGDLEGALAAGERARQLDPRHYYVNLALARVLRQQGQQAFAARNETRGCERLRRARDLQPADRDILADLSSHACATAR